jgi:hypothetical protein
MAAEPDVNAPLASSEEDELEIVVEVTDDQQVALSAGDWGVILSVQEARLLGEALMDAADDAANAEE